jgi:hypothetical protein
MVRLFICGLFKDTVGMPEYTAFNRNMTGKCLTKYHTKDACLSLVWQRLTGTEQSHKKQIQNKGHTRADVLTGDLLNTKQVCWRRGLNARLSDEYKTIK